MARVLRNVKNVVKKYTNAEVLAREATSNSAARPSNKLLSDIARYTFHEVSLYEIHGIIVKRINDNGKKWRHVLKGLVLLEHIALYGSDAVYKLLIQSSVLISTLTTFSYVDKDGMEHGKSIRDKATRLMSLIKDKQFFDAERQKLKSIGNTVAGTDLHESEISRPVPISNEDGNMICDYEADIPKTYEEEQNNLRLALAISKMEADRLRAEADRFEKESNRLERISKFDLESSDNSCEDGIKHMETYEVNLLGSGTSNTTSPMDRPRQMYDSSEDRIKKIHQQAQRIIEPTSKSCESDKTTVEEKTCDLWDELFLTPEAPVSTPQQKVLEGFQAVGPTPQLIVGFEPTALAQPQQNLQAFAPTNQPQGFFQGLVPNQQPPGYFQNFVPNQQAIVNFNNSQNLKNDFSQNRHSIDGTCSKPQSNENFSTLPLKKTETLPDNLEDAFLKQNLNLIYGTEGYLHSTKCDQFEKPKQKGSPLKELQRSDLGESFIVQNAEPRLNSSHQFSDNSQNRNLFDG